jgi:hypothetical protein
MQDMKAHLEKLRADAAECALIRDLATDPRKRELFTRLAEHLSVLAAEVESAIAAGLGAPEGS